MSCNEWERGTIKLPSSEFARLRKAVEDADRTRKERVFAQTQAYWKGLTRKQQTDSTEYDSAQHVFANRMQASVGSGGRFGYAAEGPDAEIAGDVEEALTLDRRYSNEPPYRLIVGKPKRVLAADMKYPTNRSTVFGAGEGQISFEKDTSSVTWAVGENNHAVEHARENPLAQVFFAEMAKVRWTRGTGGVIVGNNEYNREDRESGGGGNTCNQGFGPVGAADPDAWQRTNEYADSTGKRVQPAEFPGRKAFDRQMKAWAKSAGPQGRKQRGAPKSTGGQFAGFERPSTGPVLGRW